MRLKFLAALSVMMIASGAMAARMVGSEVVNLPYTVNDNSGSQWMIYQGGWMRQQGNMPVYAQAGMLLINGAGIAMNTNQARIDQKNGDLVFENLSAAGVTVTRRIHIDKKNNYVRYIEVMKNPNGQDMSVNVQLTTNFNYPIQSSQDYDDPQKKD